MKNDSGVVHTRTTRREGKSKLAELQELLKDGGKDKREKQHETDR